MLPIKIASYLLFTFLFFIISPVNLQAKDSITWMEAVAPPFLFMRATSRDRATKTLLLTYSLKISLYMIMNT